MEVKSIYLDLQKAELNKKGKKSVWKLESEAFKEPLELKIGYEDKELEQFNQRIEELREQIRLVWKSTIDWMNKWIEARDEREALNEELIRHEVIMSKLTEKTDSQNEEISQLYKVIADAKTTIETQSGTILSMGERIKELEKKTSKQPSVYSYSTFISGRERCGLWFVDVPSGEYLVISKFEVWEHNEYVTNRDEILFDKVTVDDNCYIPMYQLVGWTELDKPTATINRTLTFIPC